MSESINTLVSNNTPESPCRHHVKLIYALFQDYEKKPPFTKLLNDHGFEMKATKHALSGTMRKGECYKNATRLMIEYGLTYCEGFAMKPGLIPLSHAWVIDEQGQVIDPTWPELNTDYFGVAFNDDFVFTMMDETQYHGIGENLYMLHREVDDIFSMLKNGMFVDMRVSTG